MPRPDRFGGANEGGVVVPDVVAGRVAHDFYTPDAIAPLVISAIRANRPLVFDHANQRSSFRDLYASVVEAGLDPLDEYLGSEGPLTVNPSGPSLP